MDEYFTDSFSNHFILPATAPQCFISNLNIHKSCWVTQIGKFLK